MVSYKQRKRAHLSSVRDASAQSSCLIASLKNKKGLPFKKILCRIKPIRCRDEVVISSVENFTEFFYAVANCFIIFVTFTNYRGGSSDSITCAVSPQVTTEN